ncbi:AAA family ATPase [Jeotgalibacillus sp. ET6]|uniref:AAA family ATPase n=1 Tax=Jeotgalibacillus sp. ET6 TaxID=3037260 RepID=UPI0024188515|nr:AAA family ATPase [Jeotgalibacillus sp. ET6]MDG5472183.1 AAA family ATPase [Jeotgalibacillus sp. ET6]
MQTVYVVSGPAGAGKSTISKALAQTLASSARIEGDVVNHMVAGGYQPPWKSERLLELTWKNIADLSRNFVRSGMDVVIDYVAFPQEIIRLKQRLREQAECKIKYIVLQVKEEELVRRDRLRPASQQMGHRSIELARQFDENGINQKFILDTTEMSEGQVDEICHEILTNDRYTIED